jgi:hypothetical protein
LATPTSSADGATKGYVDNKATPVGTILMWPTTTAPTGYMICDGSTYDTTTYASLYTVLGSNQLPDFRGYFMRGYDSSRTVDTEVRDLLSVQAS